MKDECKSELCSEKHVGKVESSLDNLVENIRRSEKLAEEIIDLIEYPQPVPCSPDAVQGNNELTLSQALSRLISRVDDTNQRLALAVDILRENLGGIKLE